MKWYLMAWKRYADFEGRASRMEYWMFTLIHAVIFLALEVAFLALSALHLSAIGIPLFLACFIYALAAIFPGLSVSVRRLHDLGKSGWWMLFALVPLGAFILMVFFTFGSEPGSNQYGLGPKPAAPAAITG